MSFKIIKKTRQTPLNLNNSFKLCAPIVQRIEYNLAEKMQKGWDRGSIPRGGVEL